jgi:hypothetical protein
MSVRMDTREYDEKTLVFWLYVFADALKHRGFRLEAWLVSAAAFSLRDRTGPRARARRRAPRALRRSLTASADVLLERCRFGLGPER